MRPIKPADFFMRSSRIFMLFVLLCFGLCTTSNAKKVAEASKPEESQEDKPQQWRLLWKEKPHKQVTISWNTRTKGTVHQVLLKEAGGEPQEDSSVTVVPAHRSGQYSGHGELKLYYHHVRLKGLKPNTKYNVTLESDGKHSPEFYFITAPADARPLALLFGGDSRSGLVERRQMNKMLADMMTESQAADRPTIVAFAHGGDYVLDGRRLKQWDRWMSDHQLTVGSDRRLMPLIAARGNHDVGPLYNEIFDFPPKDKNYYVTKIGSEILFLTLNTETSTGGKQRKWLKKNLKEQRDDFRWALAQYHRPAYPAVKTPGSALVHWVPLFEQYNMDMICEADGHNIKRTMAIRNGKPDPTGVVYIGEGGLGVGQRSPHMDRWYLKKPAVAGQGHHIQLLTFNGTKLNYKAVLLDRTIFDEHTLTARTSSKKPPTEAKKTPPAETKPDLSLKASLKKELKSELKKELKKELKSELKTELKKELKAELLNELQK